MARGKGLEQQLEATQHQLRLLQRIGRQMVKPVRLGETLKQIAAAVTETLQVDASQIYLLSGDELVLCGTSQSNQDAVGEVRLRLSEGLTGWVARERRTLAISKEAHRDPRFKFFRDIESDTFEAFLSAPVITSGRVTGVINLQHRQPHMHTGDEMEMVTTIGELVGSLVGLALLDPGVFDRTDFAALAAPARERIA